MSYYYVALDDAKIVIAATEFFLCNAVIHNVNADVFSNELQQLGFPKGNPNKIFF